MHTSAWRNCRKIFLAAIIFGTKFSSSFYVISLAQKIFYCFSAKHNPKFRCVICTGVTLFTLVLYLNCTASSQKKMEKFFMHIIKNKIAAALPNLSSVVEGEWLSGLGRWCCNPKVQGSRPPPYH